MKAKAALATKPKAGAQPKASASKASADAKLKKSQPAHQPQEDEDLPVRNPVDFNAADVPEETEAEAEETISYMLAHPEEQQPSVELTMVSALHAVDDARQPFRAPPLGSACGSGPVQVKQRHGGLVVVRPAGCHSGSTRAGHQDGQPACQVRAHPQRALQLNLDACTGVWTAWQASCAFWIRPGRLRLIYSSSCNHIQQQ